MKVTKLFFLENQKLHFVPADDVAFVIIIHAHRPLDMVAKDSFLEVQPALDSSDSVHPLALGVARRFFRHLVELLRLAPDPRLDAAAGEVFVLFGGQHQAPSFPFRDHVAVEHVAEVQILHFLVVAPHVQSGDGGLVFGAAIAVGGLKMKDTVRNFV